MPPLNPPPKGRGAKSNASGRYESLAREAFDDGWTAEDPAPKKITTTLSVERARTILTRNDSPDVGFDRSINPYRGCEHGCIYCPVTQLRPIDLVAAASEFETVRVAGPA